LGGVRRRSQRVASAGRTRYYGRYRCRRGTLLLLLPPPPVLLRLLLVLLYSQFGD